MYVETGNNGVFPRPILSTSGKFHRKPFEREEG
jgi:hypothetical protein